MWLNTNINSGERSQTYEKTTSCFSTVCLSLWFDDAGDLRNQRFNGFQTIWLMSFWRRRCASTTTRRCNYRWVSWYRFGIGSDAKELVQQCSWEWHNQTSIQSNGRVQGSSPSQQHRNLAWWRFNMVQGKSEHQDKWVVLWAQHINSGLNLPAFDKSNRQSRQDRTHSQSKPWCQISQASGHNQHCFTRNWKRIVQI